MSDRFRPLSMEQLTEWAFTELDRKGSVFGMPRDAFFVPRPEHRFRVAQYGRELETPFGVAAGPHTQMAQNIVAAWLAGARVIELKTVQTLDEIEVHKPCIDVEDEGYNVEWSQELRVHQSFDEYLRAWVLIHALHRRLGWPGERPGVRFDMSVGYNLEGIRRPNVQWYLDAMADASAWLPAYVEIVAQHEPSVREIELPTRLSDTMTLSTMHGCPPDEIERITRYLLEDRRLHTSVKCNPTLLGADRVRGIVNDDLGYRDVRIPDEAFGHDLRWDDAVAMFRRLREVAVASGRTFGLKLSNTLEVENTRGAFDRDATMYLSGRALHAVTVNLADRIVGELGPALPLSFAGGADCFNVPDLVASGMRTVTVTSDLLKTGGYLRLVQYPERLDAAFDEVAAGDTADFIRRRALADGFEGDGADTAACAAFNLRRYAGQVRHEWRYRKDALRTDRSKTARTLGAFDCIEAPCTDTCPVDQAVPRYMAAVAAGDVDEAIRVTREDNPLPAVLGRVCDHLCEQTCVRTHLDQPLAIRQIKRFIMDAEETAPELGAAPPNGRRVAVIGAGPAGLAAAGELARAGFGVTVFEAHGYAGGMVGGAIPAYRLPRERIDQDLAVLERLGVEIRYSARVGRDVTISGLRADGFDAVFVGVGAQLGRRIGLPGEEADGVVDGITFLRDVHEGRAGLSGARVGVVGAGDTAMDCARSALRVGASAVSLIYRRAAVDMPADREEVEAAREEGVEIVELARPVALGVEAGRLAGVTCVRTAYGEERDRSGRRVPVDLPGSEFELPLDTLILAISQHAALDMFGDEQPALTRDGYLATDPETLATSIPGVYAGGDVSAHGPASIVRAAADGKRAARTIAASLGAPAGREPGQIATGRVDLHAAAIRRARREFRVPLSATPLEERRSFEETVLGYSREEAVAEASRCLACDELCSLCVSVCPNVALLTYEVPPIRAEIPVVAAGPGGCERVGSVSFGVEQRYQVAVLAGLCNECGTCVTACPTSGRPYRDKPRLYLDRGDFEAETTNAFLLVSDGVIEGRFGGATHRVELDGVIRYTAPGFRAVLDARTFEMLEAVAAGDGGPEAGHGTIAGAPGAPDAAQGPAAEAPDAPDAAHGRTPQAPGPRSLEPAAVLATMLAGLRGSMPQIPHVESAGTRVAEPRHG